MGIQQADVQASADPQPLQALSTDIDAQFSIEKYRLRESIIHLECQTGDGDHTLPPGFPERIESASVWGRDADVSSITHQLSADDVAQVLAAVAHFNDSGLHLNELRPDTFPLPTLGLRLRRLSRDIHNGVGSAIIQGINPDELTLEDNVIAFAGVSSYIADQRGFQSAENDVLTHLYPDDAKTTPDIRPGLSNRELPFHADNCDILALYVVQTAAHGGDTFWASIPHIYNEIVRTKPYVIDVLAKEDWAHETASKTVMYLPLLSLDDHGTPLLNFTRFALTGLPNYPRSAHIPKLSMKQQDALDTIEFLARENAVRVRQSKGDMLFLNNLAALHARGEITDEDAAEGPTTSSSSSGGSVSGGRHLMRLYLRDSENGRPIPAQLKKRWGDTYAAGREGKWVMQKMHVPSFLSVTKFNALFEDETQVPST